MTKPNFIFIMTDTQGANNLSCYGRPEMRTTHLDRLASEGIRFTAAYSTCPVCTPARGGIFSGQYPHTCGTWANEMPLALTAKTMGQRFQDNGYRTAYVGKWHLSGLDYFDTGICPEGWEEEYWYDGRRYLQELTPEEIRIWRSETSSVEGLKRHDVPAEFTWGHRISDRAIRFLNERHEKPFLLALSYDEPHGPCTCPAKYLEGYEDYRWDAGPNKNDPLTDKPALQRILADHYRRAGYFAADGCMEYPPFFACNRFVDDEIGRVLTEIDRVAPPNTWVIFTSDHGSLSGAHGGISGKGLVMYDESARIPFIVRAPGKANAGKVDPTPVSHIDILPTLLDLAGLPVPPSLDGGSLASFLRTPNTDPSRRVVVEWNRADVDGDGAGALYPVRCLIGDGYKLVVNLFDTDELYDLRHDPDELTNLINTPSSSEIRDRLQRELLDWMDRSRDPFRGPVWANRPWSTLPPGNPLRPTGRPMPDDGYLPPVLDYETGQPYAKWDSLSK